MCRSNLRSSLSGRRSKSCGHCTDTDGAETVQRTKPNRRNKETPPCRSPTRSKYTMTGHEAKEAALPCGRTGIYRGRLSLLHCRRHPKSLECSHASLTGGARRICVVDTAEGVQSVGQWVCRAYITGRETVIVRNASLRLWGLRRKVKNCCPRKVTLDIRSRSGGDKQREYSKYVEGEMMGHFG